LTLAHDLKQPLQTITLAAELLARRGAAGEKYLGHIKAGVRQLQQMIDALQDVLRLETGRLTLARERVSAAALLGELTRRAAAETAGHALTVEVEDALPALEADPKRVGQVLLCLLSNAARHGETGAPITLQVRRRGAALEFAVTNRGREIPEARRSQLFRPFSRPEPPSPRARGLGVGLYLCDGLVRAHRGRIWVESAPGETTFAFSLPLSREGT
jgi:signal transduction histidine kinase